LSLCDDRVSIIAVAYVTSEHACNSLCSERATIKVQSSSVILVKLEGTVLMDTLLGTVVTVPVVRTKFWYKPSSQSIGTKLVGTIEVILTLERQK
jgi:hypothetical protein